jgi:hypothetical protein
MSVGTGTIFVELLIDIDVNFDENYNKSCPSQFACATKQIIASQDSFRDSIYLPRLLISTKITIIAIPYSIVPKQKEKTTVDPTGSPVLVALATKFMPPIIIVTSATCPRHLVGRCTMLNQFHVI